MIHDEEVNEMLGHAGAHGMAAGTDVSVVPSCGRFDGTRGEHGANIYTTMIASLGLGEPMDIDLVIGAMDRVTDVGPNCPLMTLA